MSCESNDLHAAPERGNSGGSDLEVRIMLGLLGLANAAYLLGGD